mmetsp:Transcript_59154/g.152127  ORF Transcript_59154/g.152127 Transcript_59154/m.152127 type:complete len:294 (+) Transcript_59154:129-1010(+)
MPAINESWSSWNHSGGNGEAQDSGVLSPLPASLLGLLLPWLTFDDVPSVSLPEDMVQAQQPPKPKSPLRAAGGMLVSLAASLCSPGALFSWSFSLFGAEGDLPPSAFSSLAAAVTAFLLPARASFDVCFGSLGLESPFSAPAPASWPTGAGGTPVLFFRTLTRPAFGLFLPFLMNPGVSLSGSMFANLPTRPEEVFTFAGLDSVLGSRCFRSSMVPTSPWQPRQRAWQPAIMLSLTWWSLSALKSWAVLWPWSSLMKRMKKIPCSGQVGMTRESTSIWWSNFTLVCLTEFALE